MSLRGVKSFFTRNLNNDNNAFAWYNTNVLNEEALKDLDKYFNGKKEFKHMVVINECVELRPQRTWGTFPTFLKCTDGFHDITRKGDRAFILISWLKDNNAEEIEELENFISDTNYYILSR